MKKNIVIIIFLSLCFTCEDVIDVNLNEVEPRLVIEASINWYKNTTGNEQSVKLSLSAPFYDETIPPANNAIVQIIDNNGTTFNFIEENNSGIYRNFDFIPVIDAEYQLFINYEDEVYTATETLKSVVPIDYIEQNNDGGFTGDEIEVKVYFTDPLNIDNYYFFEYSTNISNPPSLDVAEDEFIDGNQIFGFYSDEDLESGDELTIKHFGISNQFYEYMYLLLQQGSDDGGGPFETQPATVRGNCVNITNEDNYPFGYFRLSEVVEENYIIE
ncbi:DUF4249 domain-containing protein [Winogradskyella endarachnes]|uniref:DUF4249 family protein n=1 Tax=Winogradskyella endarachnes TaxID=2681965 RepID=A0A6L6U7K7_9FLAO|nr:DUF4249 domain-containing protein [Winogradskyella endarachnes]MUU76814.1 DUF4249 family protein [Winogradskyella endarachnes]